MNHIYAYTPGIWKAGIFRQNLDKAPHILKVLPSEQVMYKTAEKR